MKTSETIGHIALALATAQIELSNPVKDKKAIIKSDKGSFNYTYADFATALEIIRPVMAKHKIAIVQATRVDDRFIFLESRIIHESGEWIGNEYPVGPMAEHRVMGSALSYARRYSLFPLIGVQGEDDDDGESDHNGNKTHGKKDDKPADEKSAMGIANGTPGASKAANRGPYDLMVKAIRNAPTLKALDDWYKSNVTEIENLPPDFVDELRIEFVDRKSELNKALAV